MPVPRVCVFTVFDHFDQGWWARYANEMERTGLRFAVHFHHCQHAVIQAARRHPMCCGIMEENDPTVPLTEQHGYRVFQHIAGLRQFDWALELDPDEVLEPDGPLRLQALVHYENVDWLRVAVTGFTSEVRLYNLHARHWTVPQDSWLRLPHRKEVADKFNLTIQWVPDESVATKS